MRTRRLRALIFANIGLILTGFVILELLFGSWVGKGDPHVLLTIPRGIRVTVDAGDLYDDPSGTAVVYSRDEYGLRGPYQGIGEIDVLTIGGSTNGPAVHHRRKDVVGRANVAATPLQPDVALGSYTVTADD